jgi:hypothetical protein
MINCSPVHQHNASEEAVAHPVGRDDAGRRSPVRSGSDQAGMSFLLFAPDIAIALHGRYTTWRPFSRKRYRIFSGKPATSFAKFSRSHVMLFRYSPVIFGIYVNEKLKTRLS